MAYVGAGGSCATPVMTGGTSTAAILVLFILLVIITRAFAW
jgi:uncharacterized protein (TIGR01732 family)